MWGCVLVADNDDGLSFRSGEGEQFKTIANGADISCIGMQEIDGPIFRLVPVVAEGPRYFELQCPVAFDEQIRCALCNR